VESGAHTCNNRRGILLSLSFLSLSLTLSLSFPFWWTQSFGSGLVRRVGR
jgi:hypothetical protein